MCSVIGFNSPEQKMSDLLLLTDIFEQSKVRGLHAFGFSYLGSGHVVTVKSNDFNELMKELGRAWPFTNLIGHCRYSTSGDWEVPENNQPVVWANSAMVFNGVISMKTKAEMEVDFNMVMQSENDGELAIRNYYRDPSGFPKWLKNTGGSFAGIFLNPSSMIAFRNSRRPLWAKVLDGSTFIASTNDILRRAGVKDGVCLPDSVEWRIS